MEGRHGEGSGDLAMGDASQHLQPYVMPEHYLGLTVKIGDHEINGGLRYKAWAHHRDRVLERLGGWQLMANGQDFATFNIPQSIVAAAATERQTKVPKEDRRYWGDKSDFCRCLEVVLNEMEPRSDKTPAPSSYMLFCQDKRLEHKEAGHAAPLDVKELGVMWKGLNDEERKPWTEKADQIKASGATLDMPRKRSKSKLCAPCGGSPPQPLPPAVQQVCAENGLDPMDVLIRLIEHKQPMELMGYERRLRVIMNRLHELQFQIATSMPPKKRSKRDHAAMQEGHLEL